MSLQQSNNQSRPVQTSMLVMLPTEIILEIVGAVNNSDWGSGLKSKCLDSLSQTCSRLCVTVRPLFFRSEGFRQFFISLRSANVAMLDRCEYYNAAPIDRLWPSSRSVVNQETCVDILLRGLNMMRPENEQQTNIHDKRRENTLNGLKWLLERGAEGRTTRRFRNYPSNDLQLLSHMSTALLASMQLGHSKRSMEALFNMLKMLSSHGYPNPTRSDTFDPAWLFPNNYEWRCVRLSFYSKASPMCITLKSHVVPSVLELMLSEHADRGNKLRDRYSECPASLAKIATRMDSFFRTTETTTNWTELNYIDRLIRILHSDLHEEGTGWEEAYFGEVADIFQAKLKLMVKYEMIDTSEEALLKSIGSAFYSIAADGMQAGGYDQEHIKRSWEKLCDAVKPFATDRNLVVVNPDGTQHRIHRFVIDPEWNPWESWFWRQDEIRWMREGAGSIYASRGTLSVPYERASSLGVPEWHTVSMDAWYASFPRSG